MEKNFVDMGHRVETEPELGQVRDVADGARGSRKVVEDIGAALKKASSAVGNGIQDRTSEVIAYARREPAAALTAAAVTGFLAGLCVAIGSRAAPSGARTWLPRMNPRRSGWRGFLRSVRHHYA